MPRGRTSLPKAVSPEQDDSEYNFQLSQTSASSDDHALELAVAEQYMASKEKKKKEAQKKFLASGHRLVQKELSAVSNEMQETKQSIEEIHEAFLINYAAEQDNIRQIWTEILEEHRRLQSIIKERIKSNEASAAECETAQIKGMAKVQEACFEIQRVIDFIDPSAAEAVPAMAPNSAPATPEPRTRRTRTPTPSPSQPRQTRVQALATSCQE
ncbi:hypothetical protein D9758_003537 [Tetrapyrgos nigripes]|uniref:Uncharacterized protein n=1 Tax=Tetrapyrgos nigripes TaxID=182062 RepID=A0A8H5GVB8_9AGAR|nr:hypothetical protein D9758_003537 [Tetrapyrgos nigripes]